MIDPLYDKYLESTGVCTDTRLLKEGNMFFALRGPNFNGNGFAGEAVEKGASCAVIDDPGFKNSPKHVVVENSLAALQDLAVKHRSRLDIPFIGITGSNGKTTTKELIHAVLSVKFNTVATSGNLNNHIGVPLTVLSVKNDTEIAIIEMGANKPGDIKELCRIADPGYGIITNIGKAHIDGFGSIDGVLKAKTELFDHLLRNGGKVFINTADPVLSNMSKRFQQPLLYPGKNDFYHCEPVQADPFLAYCSENGDLVETSLIGAYNFSNIAGALCIGKFFGIEEKQANNAVKNYVPSNMRSQMIRKGGSTVILDAYNANPGSMEAALTTLNGMHAARRIAILGDMFELGDIAEMEHARIGTITADLDLDEVLLCGKLMSFAHDINSSAKYFPDKKMLEEYLEKAQFRNSAILIKASRGMALETVINHMHIS